MPCLSWLSPAWAHRGDHGLLPSAQACFSNHGGIAGQVLLQLLTQRMRRPQSPVLVRCPRHVPACVTTKESGLQKLSQLQWFEVQEMLLTTVILQLQLAAQSTPNKSRACR